MKYAFPGPQRLRALLLYLFNSWLLFLSVLTLVLGVTSITVVPRQVRREPAVR